MSSLYDLVASIPARLIIVAAVSGAFFLLYFSLDIYLFLTKRHFGRVNIELVHFTRNDFNSARKSGAIQFRTIEGPICLKQVYNNRLLFWRVIFRSLKATLDVPVVDFGTFTYAALVLFRDRVAAKCSVGQFKRALGSPFKEEKYQIVMVNERSEDKRRYILKVLVIREADLRNIESYRKETPVNSNNFKVFKEAARVFQEKPKTFLPVKIIAT